MRYAPVAALVCVACVPRLECADAVGGLPLACAPPREAPSNRWPSSDPPAGLRAEGMGVGQIAYDVRGVDQFGEEVSLWQFHDRIVIFDVSTMWCRPCQQLAIGTEAVWQDYKDRDFMYLTAILENVDDEAPTVEELNQWAALAASDPEHDYTVITAPIISDPEGATGSAEAVRNNQYPAVLLIDRDLRVARRLEPVSDELIREAVEEALAE